MKIKTPQGIKLCGVFSLTKTKKLPQRESLRADNRIWTGDLILTKDVLYQLSYISALHRLQQLYIIHYFQILVKWFSAIFYVFYGWQKKNKNEAKLLTIQDNDDKLMVYGHFLYENF